MKNFIEELYYGRLDPQARCFDSDSNTEKNIAAVAEVESSLNAAMDDNAKELFREYERLNGEITADSSLDSFIVGFKMGAEFTYDTFIGNEAPYRQTE